MNKLPQALAELLCDPDGKRAEECLLAVLADLERSGLRQRAIANALSRVLLGFCAEHGKHPGNFGWANDVLDEAGKVLNAKAARTRRAWVRKFMAKTGRLYREASFEIEIELPEVRQALDARLSALDMQGQA